MRIILLLIKDLFRKILRHFYWIFRLMQAKTGKGVQIKFPIKVEGSGKLILGDNCKLDKNVYLACGSGCKISFGKNCRIDEGVEIIAGKHAQISFGDNCWIMKNTIIRTGDKFEFGDNIQIATNCAIFSRESGHEGELKVGTGTHIGDNTIIDTTDNMSIEDEVAIGPNCVIYTHDHDYTNMAKAAWQGGVVKHSVSVKKGSWVGSNVTILPNIEVAERCVVAAGAVLTKSTKTNFVYAGVPAKPISEIIDTTNALNN